MRQASDHTDLIFKVDDRLAGRRRRRRRRQRRRQRRSCIQLHSCRKLYARRRRRSFNIDFESLCVEVASG